MKITSVLPLAAVSLFAWLSTAAAEHPAQGYFANSLEHLYGPERGLPPEWSFENITFTKVRRPASELSEVEKYIIAGSSSSAFGKPLLPWTHALFTAVELYYEMYGHVPFTLDEATLRSIPQFKDASSEMLELFKNPLSNAWPLLNSEQHSAGNAYITRLSASQMEHFAAQSPTYREQWFEDRIWSEERQGYRNAELTSGVYYFRIYGSHGTLLENLTYRMSYR